MQLLKQHTPDQLQLQTTATAHQTNLAAPLALSAITPPATEVIFSFRGKNLLLALGKKALHRNFSRLSILKRFNLCELDVFVIAFYLQFTKC